MKNKLIIILITITLTLNAKTEPYLINLATSIDLEKIPSNIYLECKSTDYKSISIKVFLKKEKYNHQERYLKNILQGINNISLFQGTEEEKNMIKLYSSNFKADWNSVKIKRIIELENSIFWVISLKYKRYKVSDEYYMTFQFQKKNINKYKWTFPNSYISSLINQSLQTSTIKNPKIITDDYNTCYIPNISANIYLKGKSFNYLDTSNSQEKLNNGILDIIQKSYFTLSNGTIKEYAALLTSHSKKMFLKSMEDITPELYKRGNIVSKFRKKYVCYIIDCSPIYIVYYSMKPNIKDHTKMMQEYVYYDKNKNEYKLTNLNYLGFFQQFIKENDSIKKYILEKIKKK